ncbi:hypothetical protein D3C73_848060 [compost metagenome]
MHLAVQRLANAWMSAHERHLCLLIRNHVDADIEATQLGGLQLDIGRLEIGAGQVHDPVHDFLGPAVLVHGNRLIHRYCIGGFRRSSLGQRRQTVGEIVDPGVTGGGLQVLEALTDQTAERLFPILAGAVLVSLHIEHTRHTGGEVLRRGRLTVRLRLGGRRCSLGLCLAGGGNMTTLLHRHAHCWQGVERVCLWIEITFSRHRRLLRSYHHCSNRRFNLRLHRGHHRCRLRRWLGDHRQRYLQ